MAWVPKVMWRPSSARILRKPSCRVGSAPQVGAGVDDDLVGGHRQHAFHESAVEGHVAHEAALYLALVALGEGLLELGRVLRQPFVRDLLDLEAPRRVHRLAPREEVGDHLGRVEDPNYPLVPLGEELGVLGLLHRERAEEHDPVVAPERPRRDQHRDHVLGDDLLAGEEADRDPEQRPAALLREPLPVLDVLGVVEVARIPDAVDRLLVLAVDRARPSSPARS